MLWGLVIRMIDGLSLRTCQPAIKANLMSLAVRRHLIGVMSILLMIAAFVLWTSYDENIIRVIASGCLRGGLVSGAAWLAFPQVIQLKEKASPKMMIAIILGTLMIVVRPKSFPIVALVVAAVAVVEFVGWVLKPIDKKRKS